MPARRMTRSITPALAAWLDLRQHVRGKPWLGWLAAAGFVAGAAALRFALGADNPAPFMPFYPAILFATLIAGRRIGYAALAVSLACVAWFFTSWPPATSGPGALTATVLFGVIATSVIEVIAWLSRSAESLREAETELRAQARDLAGREAQAAARLGELEALYEQAPLGLAFLDQDLRFVRVNPALAEINGFSVADHLGHCVWDLLPSLRDTAEPLLVGVLRTNRPAHAVELSGETPARPGVIRHWMETFYPVRGPDGAVQGVGIVCQETTAMKEAQERESLLQREVDHRAKNLLAVVQSVVQLTRFRGDPAEFKGAILSRIQSLGRVHALLSDNRWEGVRLDEVIRAETAPFSEAVQVTLLDEPLHLAPGAAQALSLVLHELITNSAKYGALSGEGQVALACSCDGAADSLITLAWREASGPAVGPVGQPGFGTTLIRAAVNGSLGGELDYRLQPDGLACTIRFPRSAGAAGAAAA